MDNLVIVTLRCYVKPILKFVLMKNALFGLDIFFKSLITN